jgi:unsaturated rhamnogalacturonyl hydrolase
MVQQFVTVEPNGLVSITNICKVRLGGDPPRDGSYAYYVSEPVVATTTRAWAFILAAHELGR